MATDAAKGLIRDLTAAGQAYEAGDSNARRILLDLCKELTAELEQPGETFLRLNWAEVSERVPHRARNIETDSYAANKGDCASCRT
jgi:hypothetical protein